GHHAASRSPHSRSAWATKTALLGDVAAAHGRGALLVPVAGLEEDVLRRLPPDLVEPPADRLLALLALVGVRQEGPHGVRRRGAERRALLQPGHGLDGAGLEQLGPQLVEQ